MVRPEWLLAAVLLTGCGAPAVSGSEATGPSRDSYGPLRSWIAGESERLSAAAAELGEDGADVAADLAAVAAEAEAGRPLYSASRLPTPRNRIEAPAYRSERRYETPDLEALEAVAARVGTELERMEAGLTAAAPGRPAAVRALADAGWIRARAYHRSAVAYARVTSVDSGLYYLGAARSLLGTAAELVALPLEVPTGTGATAPSAAALEAELADLDRRTIAAYRDPGAEVERHSAFIALNAEIKEARDLLAAGRPDGALLAALEARRRLEEVLDEGAGPDTAELRERTARFRDRCASAPWDASLGGLFVETAEAALAGESPGSGGVGRARAILLHVLPRYFELHEETP